MQLEVIILSKPFDYITDALLWVYEFGIEKHKRDDAFSDDSSELTLPALGLTDYEKIVLMESLISCLDGHKPTRKGVTKSNYQGIKNKYPDITEDELIYCGWLRRIMANIFYNAISLAIAENFCFITLNEVIWGLESLGIFHFNEEEIRTLINIINIKLKDRLSYNYSSVSQK